MRSLVVALVVLASVTCLVAPSGASVAAAAPSAPARASGERCCKVCDRGKACGDSCIARAKTCHKPRGCACDASETGGG